MHDTYENPTLGPSTHTKVVRRLRMSWEKSSLRREVKDTRTVRRGALRGDASAPPKRASSPPPQVHSSSPIGLPPSFRDRLEREQQLCTTTREDAKRRIASHPIPFRHGRSVLPDQRALINHPSKSTPRYGGRASTPQERSECRPRSIMRPPSRSRYVTPDLPPHLGQH